eukprot:554864-Pyramimonas_sp.AAC.1
MGADEVDNVFRGGGGAARAMGGARQEGFVQQVLHLQSSETKVRARARKVKTAQQGCNALCVCRWSCCARRLRLRVVNSWPRVVNSWPRVVDSLINFQGFDKRLLILARSAQQTGRGFVVGEDLGPITIIKPSPNHKQL